MALIKWNNHYSVHVAEIDNQHKELIDLINRMYDAMRDGKGRDVLGPVLTKLAEYTVCHFTTEEQLFQQYGYPEYETHKRYHDDLSKKTTTLKNEFDQGNNQLTMEVMMFLSNWLNYHILEEDKKYGPFLNSRGVL